MSGNKSPFSPLPSLPESRDPGPPRELAFELPPALLRLYASIKALCDTGPPRELIFELPSAVAGALRSARESAAALVADVATVKVEP